MAAAKAKPKKKRVRKRNRAAKGPQYERELCRALSLWWSGGKDSDLFWRASQSGGRATQRAKSGKRTAGHCGDLCCTTSEGEPLIQVVTIESKRGYNRSAHMADLLDRKEWPTDPKLRKRTMLGMIEQAAAAANRAGTPYWLLIHRRDKREALVYMPAEFCKRAIGDDVSWADRARLFFGDWCVVVVKLEDFLTLVKPATVRKIARNLHW
jgi:hypothetical protein